MASVLLIGFDHLDSVQFVEELKRGAPQHDFRVRDVTATEQSDPTSAIALIWCPRSMDDAATMISEAVAAGLPAVALLQDSSVPGIDLSAGHVEFSFSPTDCTETLRRIDLVGARAHGTEEDNLIKHGDLVIDQDRYEVRLNDRKIDLTYKEYELLKYIAARPGRVFSREALLRAVWDYDYFGGTRTVDVHVRRLRSKINDVRYQFIETVWNVGYKFRS